MGQDPQRPDARRRLRERRYRGGVGHVACRGREVMPLTPERLGNRGEMVGVAVGEQQPIALAQSAGNRYPQAACADDHRKRQIGSRARSGSDVLGHALFLAPFALAVCRASAARDNGPEPAGFTF